MALQAPQYNGPRMGQMPFVPADADAFGAAEARQAGKLAGTGRKLGLDLLEAAQEQQKRCDTAAVKDATNRMRLEMLEESERILAGDGVNAPEEMAAAHDRLHSKYGAALAGGNIERQEMFNAFSREMRDSYALQAERKRVAGVIGRERDAVNAEVEANFREIGSLGRNISDYANQEDAADEKGNVHPPVHPGDEFAKRLLKIHSDIDAMLPEDAPHGYRRQLKSDATTRAHILITDEMSLRNPRAALDWLDNPQVRSAMPAKEWEAQREAVAGMLEMVETGEDAENAAATMTPGDALMRAYTEPRYQGDREARERYLFTVTEIAGRNRRAREAETAEQHVQWGNEFAAGGCRAVPPAAMKNRALAKSLMEYGTRHENFLKENPIPDAEFLISLLNKPQDGFNAFFANPGNMPKYFFALAGDEDWKSAVEEKLRGGQAAPGRAGVYGGMNLSEQIRANFPALRPDAAAEEEYDAGNPEHYRMSANFMHVFRGRWNSAENHGDAAPMERAENIFYDIISDHREGRLDLAAPIYDAAMAARLQEQAENPVIESVNPETGAEEITLVDAGEVKTFEKIDPSPFGRLVKGFTPDIGFRVPEKARAGTYRGAAYRPGDTILIERDKLHRMSDSIMVLDENHTPRRDQARIGPKKPEGGAAEGGSHVD